MKKIKTVTFCIGILMLLSGVLLSISAGGVSKFPFCMMGMGSGIVGVGVFYMLYYKNAERVKEYEVNEKDERNIRLREKAGYTTWFITQFVLCVMVLTFLILDYGTPLWIALGALFIHNAGFIVSVAVHDKNM